MPRRSAPSRPRPGVSGKTRVCASCKEPSEYAKKIGNGWLCDPCIARLRAHAQHKSAQEHGTPQRQELNDARKNRDGDRRRGEDEVYYGPPLD